LYRSWDYFEVSRNVTAENASLKCLDMTSNIRLRGKQMTFVRIAMCIFVSVWHNDVPSVSFHLRKDELLARAANE
jgi:hypothetical protein